MGVKSAAVSGGNTMIKRRSKAEVGGPSEGWWKECHCTIACAGLAGFHPGLFTSYSI